MPDSHDPCAAAGINQIDVWITFDTRQDNPSCQIETVAGTLREDV
jgi:hypothetical protein